MHQDPKNNWIVPFKIHIFARFSLVSLSIHPRSRRGAERIDQQQQQSVASAILATTQQSVRNIITTLIITPTFRVHQRFVCGDNYTWKSCGIFLMRSWKMDRRSWTNTYGTTLWSGDEKDWRNIVPRTAIFKSDHSVCCPFSIFFMVWSVLLCSHTRSASISLVSYLD